MLLLHNARLATMNPALPGLGLIERGAVAIAADGTIAFAGAEADAPTGGERINCDGRLLTPGLIDCHTHLVFGGDRAKEFEMRLAGASYEAIAKAGGGIVSTVAATRAASEAELVAAARPRLKALMHDGVTTIEIKSGYGLTVHDETKMLCAARALGRTEAVSVVTTHLGAHTLPPEYRTDRAAYVKQLCDEQIPLVARDNLADAVDGFCEGIAFSVDEMRQVFAAAKAHGLPIKLHAEQLSNLGGAAMAASLGALSCDHIEYLDETGAEAMGRAGTVGVLLPGAFHYLKETRKPPVEALRRHGVRLAIATDANPGSSPVYSLRTAMTLACLSFGLSVEEALLGVTRHAAAALGRAGTIGQLTPGAAADFCLWNTREAADLVYLMGLPLLAARYHKGLPT